MDELDIHDLELTAFAEDADVVNWRACRLLKLGYAPGDAAELAATRIDLHKLERLIQRGCPCATAVRIAA
jgi:hypothetical protein